MSVVDELLNEKRRVHEANKHDSSLATLVEGNKASRCRSLCGTEIAVCFGGLHNVDEQRISFGLYYHAQS